jgi:glucose dehydrogenase
VNRTARVEQTEICIIGTGAAGGILAYRLAMAGRDVLSLEQGADICDDYFTNGVPPEQAEHFGIAPDRPWPPPPGDAYLHVNAQASRLYARADTMSTTPDSAAAFVNLQIFRLNGKQNVWGGASLRQSPRDFRARDFGDGDVNWPIGYDDLDRHYTEVERLIGVCGTREGLDELPDGEFLPPMPLRPIDEFFRQSLTRVRGATIRAIPHRKTIETRPDAPNVCPQCGHCIHGCRTGSIYKFSSRLLPKILGRRNYRIRYETKVVALRLAAGSNRVEAAECLDTRTREPFEIRAEVFVVAAGALESARLLLNSRNDGWPEGLANSSGMVGRYLQDNVGAVAVGALRKFAGTKATFPEGAGDHLLIPRFLFDREELRGGFQVQCGHSLPWVPLYLESMRHLPARLKDFLVRKFFCTFFGLVLFGKPAARASNRLLRSDQRDIYGVSQVAVEYRWTEDDLRMQKSMRHWGRKILKAASAIGIATFAAPRAGRGIHYAGTCRMASAPGDGVVDHECRAFDHPNLYVCDGGIMPELSEKNPTLTIMALANRLAEALAAGGREP